MERAEPCFFLENGVVVTKMNWRRVHFETRGRDHGYTSIADEEHRFDDKRRVKITPVRVDEAFWREWRKNKARMKAKGYHVDKNADGRWEAWREQMVDRK
jgi:hypothetical protein